MQRSGPDFTRMLHGLRPTENICVINLQDHKTSSNIRQLLAHNTSSELKSVFQHPRHGPLSAQTQQTQVDICHLHLCHQKHEFPIHSAIRESFPLQIMHFHIKKLRLHLNPTPHSRRGQPPGQLSSPLCF